MLILIFYLTLYIKAHILFIIYFFRFMLAQLNNKIKQFLVLFISIKGY